MPPEKDSALFYALILFSVAVLTDAFDGFFARLLKQETKLGLFLDPFADKLLLTFGFLAILLSAQPVFKPPMWILITIIFREIVITFIFLVIFSMSRKLELKPNLLGKFTTVAQMVLMMFCILNNGSGLAAAFIAAGLTILSGIVYALRELPRFSKELL